MLSRTNIRAVLALAAIALALPLAGDSASAEDGTVYGVRDQCIDQVGGGYAGIYGNAESNYGTRTRRTSTRAACARTACVRDADHAHGRDDRCRPHRCELVGKRRRICGGRAASGHPADVH